MISLNAPYPLVLFIKIANLHNPENELWESRKGCHEDEDQLDHYIITRQREVAFLQVFKEAVWQYMINKDVEQESFTSLTF